MTGGRQRSIAKVRTFGEDVSRARGGTVTDRVTPAATPTAAVPPPTAPVSPQQIPVPPVPERAPAVRSTPAPVPEAPTSTKLAVPQVSELTELSAQVSAPVSPLAMVHSTALPDLSAADGELTEGTIISDKKRTRFKLFPAIGQAVGGWVGDAKENLTAKPEEASVRKVEARLETLKAAAKVSSLVPQDDHGIVVKRITEVARTPVVPTANIKAAAAVPPPQWKHTESDAETPRSTESTTGPIEPAPRRVTLTVSAADQPREAVPPTTPPAPPAAPVVPAARPEPVRVAVREPDRAPVYAPEPVRVAPPVVEAAAPGPRREAATGTRPRRSIRGPLTVIVVILGTSLLGGGVGVLWYLRQETTMVREVPPSTSLVLGGTSVSVPLGDTREALLTTLLGDTLRATSLTTFTFFVTDTPAPLAAQLQALSWRAPGNFLRSIRDITLGSTATSQPFIVIKGTDFNTGFAGMLAWEAAISSDLSPLFGTPVTESFDPTARTDTQLRAAFFRDDIVGNVSVRILVDETNTERIIYGFLSPNLILITTNRAAFELLQPTIAP